MVKIIPAYGIALRIGGWQKFVWWPLWIFWPLRVARFARKFLPYFYSLGFMDCDDGGRVFEWRPMWALNWWHADRVLDECQRHSDGLVIQQSRLFNWLNWRLWLWRHGLSRNYVGAWHKPDPVEFCGQWWWR